LVWLVKLVKVRVLATFEADTDETKKRRDSPKQHKKLQGNPNHLPKSGG
jgi:hypothetical protein